MARKKTKASEPKYVTAKSIEKALGINKNDITILTCGDGDNTVDVIVKTSLSLNERSNMIKDIADMVFRTSEDGTQEYVSYFKRFAVAYNILAYFTNIDLSLSGEEAWDFITATNIVEVVSERIPGLYLNDILVDADELIEYKKKVSINRSKFDEILKMAGEVFTLIKSKTEDLETEQLVGIVQQHVPELKDKLISMLNADVTVSE